MVESPDPPWDSRWCDLGTGECLFHAGAAPVGDGAGVGVCDDVYDGGLAAGVGPLQGGFDLGGVFDFFAVAAEGLGHFVEGGEAELPARLSGVEGAGGPACVVADDGYYREVVADCRVDLHSVHAHGAVAVEDEDLLVGLGELGAYAVGKAHAHGTGDTSVEPVA